MSPRTPPTPPARRPLASLVGTLAALALIAVGVVAVRDLVVTQGWSAGSPWTPAAVTALDGLTATTTVVVVGVVCGVLALVLLYLTLRPATRTHRSSPVDGADLWVSPGAVAALARDAADRTSGVRAAEARATKRRVRVTATSDGSEGVEAAVRAAVDRQLASVTSHSVQVRVRAAQEDS